MQLYSFFQSSTAYRVRIALNLKGLTPAMHYVSLTQGEQRSDAYAAVNPAMIVPTLIDGDFSLHQSLAIMEYLDEAYPETHALLPRDVKARAYARMLALTIAADTSPLGNLKLRKYLAGALAQPEESVVAFLNHWIAVGLTALEKLLVDSPYTGRFAMGAEPGLVDCCIVPQLFAARRWKHDLSAYPTIQRIADACESHPAFIAAHPLKQADAV